MNNDDIEQFLSSWYKIKQERSEMDKKLDKFKKVALKLMEENNENFLQSKKYVLTKKDSSRRTISRMKVPTEIWNTYSTKTTYNIFNIRKRQ